LLLLDLQKLLAMANEFRLDLFLGHNQCFPYIGSQKVSWNMTLPREDAPQTGHESVALNPCVIETGDLRVSSEGPAKMIA
jgi:hypothetical protein